jgi:trigger factor
MRVSTETTSGLERRLTIGVPAESVDGAVEQRLKDASRNVRLPGFRPGKVPMRVMKQRFGTGVRQEVLGEVIGKSFQEAVIQEKLRPAGQPKIDPLNIEPGADLEFTATFEVFPEIEVKDIESLKVTRPTADVTESDIDDIIEVFRKQQGSLKPVDRPAESGDTVVIDFEGTKEGVAFEGGSAQDSTLELGSGRMIPGFEDGIVGMSVGEQKTVPLTFPEDYNAEELRGAAVEFAITLKEVKALELAPIDEELFKTYGVEEGGEDTFRAEVRKNMERELRNAVESHVKQQVMDAVLAENTDLLVPKALVGQEINGMRSRMLQQFGGMSNQNLDLQSLLPDEMFSEQAEKRVKLGLLLAEYISRFELRADPTKVREAIEDIASTYQDPQEVIDYFYSENEQLASVESRVLEDQVVEKMLANADIEEKACTYQEALAEARPQQQG